MQSTSGPSPPCLQSRVVLAAGRKINAGQQPRYTASLQDQPALRRAALCGMVTNWQRAALASPLMRAQWLPAPGPPGWRGQSTPGREGVTGPSALPRSRYAAFRIPCPDAEAHENPAHSMGRARRRGSVATDRACFTGAAHWVAAHTASSWRLGQLTGRASISPCSDLRETQRLDQCCAPTSVASPPALLRIDMPPGWSSMYSVTSYTCQRAAT
jgi:hypothetical protein